ncbi:Pentatricopeptide repeat-containing protein [Apostasia shenzhenica]|uniref:Pentatricopeptide repeat-containing protein n=1 Tax=Apostasia shenzhenica TaxID=1088818 RepID=A0A2I0ATQ4_9ASPA|nr:Pentatricopeptide repeat-containing protein [Apostasia shenzhenica]
MLRSIRNVSFSFFCNRKLDLLKPIACLTCETLRPFILTKRSNYGRVVCSSKIMTDVLSILLPLDDAFLSSEAVFYVNLLRKCISSKNLLIARLVHDHLIKLGFVSEAFVSNVLLNVYAKARSFDDGNKLFDEMPHRDLFSWCTLISGYVSHGFNLEAYCLFKRMIQMGTKPNHFVVSSVLKACSALEILELGALVYGLAVKGGLTFDTFVEVALVGVYAKCGAFDDALKLFYEIPVKSSVCWNAIISGCIQNGYLLKAAEMSREMCRIGFIMDLVTLRIVMRASSALEMPDFCKLLHVYSIKIGLDTDSYVVAELVRLLINLGKVAYMSEVFGKVRRPDVSLYALLISGYHLHGHRAEAVKLAEELFVLKYELKEGALVIILNLCLLKEECTQIHACILKYGYLSYLSVGNALISVYFRSGEMLLANETFHEMPVHDSISWTAIMTGLIHSFHFEEALERFQAFLKTDMQLDQHCVATAVNACTGLLAIDEGRQIHALAVKHGLDFSNFINASILHMYAKCGYIDSAARLFSYASFSCDLVLTNVMLAGYCWNSKPLMALDLFRWEYQAGLVPDQFSLSTILGACADMKSLKVGEHIHCLIVKSGFEFSDIVVGNSIVSMYVKSGNMNYACKFFYSMRRRSVILYQMLMLGYLSHKGKRDPLILFTLMQRSPLCVAFARILRGSDIDVSRLFRNVQATIVKMGLVSDFHMRNTPMGLFDVASSAASHELLGDNTSCGVVFSEYPENGETGRNFDSQGHSKLKDRRQDRYSYLDGIDFYLDIAYPNCEPSSFFLRQNDLIGIGTLKSLESDNYKNASILDNKWSVVDTISEVEVFSWKTMASGYGQNNPVIVSRRIEQGLVVIVSFELE